MDDIIPNSELVVLYLSECGQIVQKLERIILNADKSGELTDSAELFRLLHTLKGSSAMMEYAPLVEVAHSFENIFAILKTSDFELSKDELELIVDGALNFVSYFQDEFLNIRNGVAPKPDQKLNSEINALAERFGVRDEVTVSMQLKGESPVSAATERREGEHHILVKLRECPLPHIRAFLIAKSVADLCSYLGTYPENLEKSAKYDEVIRKDGYEIRFVPKAAEKIDEIISKVSMQPYVASCTVRASRPVSPDRQERSEEKELLKNVTVSQLVINNLISYIGEIASAESLLETYVEESGIHNRKLQELLSTLRHSVIDANSLAAQIGTHDVGSVFVQMQRTIRNMGRDLNKDIKVRTLGDDVQVDKSILELLSDSLIHLVRNAVDHGIEPPGVREAHGKPRTGMIILAASKMNNFLTVTVSDDGAGIKRQTLLDKAERLGKLTKPKELYTDTEVCSLLLSSGISTKTNVTQYSGRGVGLDTVLNRVKNVGGNITIESKEGSGTVFSLRIPISLMIIDGIEVSLRRGNELIIPVNSIQHIHDCGSSDTRLVFYEGKNRFNYNGEEYTELTFPGEEPQTEIIDSGYIVLFERGYGRHYIHAEKVKMMATYYVKKMPEFVSDALKHNYIYSGCILCADLNIRCVLDVGRLINLSDVRESSERRINL